MMVVVGAHFLLRCLDLERFVHHVVKVIRFLTLLLSLISFLILDNAFVRYPYSYPVIIFLTFYLAVDLALTLTGLLNFRNLSP